MPSWFEAVALSLDVYQDPARPSLPEGWVKLIDSSQTKPAYTKDGYLGAIYYKKLEEGVYDIVIAHRGTPGFWSWSAIEDFEFWVMNKLPAQYTDSAKPFVEYVKQNFKDKFPHGTLYSVSYVGHSLGAILAELCVGQQFYGYPESAMTFESPGSKTLMQQMVSLGHLPKNAVEYASLTVCTSNADVNAINTCYEQIDLYLEYPAAVGYDYKIGTTMVPNKLYFFLKFTCEDQHKIIHLYDYWKEKKDVYPSKKNKLKKLNSSWPIGFSAAYDAYLTYGGRGHAEAYWDDYIQYIWDNYPESHVGYKDFTEYYNFFRQTFLKNGNKKIECITESISFPSAAFSLDVYRDDKVEMPTGWRHYLDCPQELIIDDYFGAAYINDTERLDYPSVIIAHRGSKTIPNYIEDFLIFIKKVPYSFMNNACPFIDYVKTVLDVQYGVNNYSLSFTGHSLGAILAELSMAREKALGVTFESPGSKAMVQSMVQGKKLPDSSLEWLQFTLKIYMANVNAINTCNEQSAYGLNIFCFSPKYNFHMLEKLPNYPNFSYYIYYFTIKNQHKMLGLYKVFSNNLLNEKLGKPNVRDYEWPCGLTNGFRAHLQYDVTPNCDYWEGYMSTLWSQMTPSEKEGFENKYVVFQGNFIETYLTKGKIKLVTEAKLILQQERLLLIDICYIFLKRKNELQIQNKKLIKENKIIINSFRFLKNKINVQQNKNTQKPTFFNGKNCHVTIYNVKTKAQNKFFQYNKAIAFNKPQLTELNKLLVQDISYLKNQNVLLSNRKKDLLFSFKLLKNKASNQTPEKEQADCKNKYTISTL